jgi:hypothetical protein
MGWTHQLRGVANVRHLGKNEEGKGMQYLIAAAVHLGSFALMMAGSSDSMGGLLGMGIAGLAWPVFEYSNHLMLHTDKAPRHTYHHQHSREYPEIRVNLGPASATMHAGAVIMLWWIGSWAIAMGYSGTFALLYALYEAAHEWGHMADKNMFWMSWALQNSHAWHWQHHIRPNRNFGVSTPFYDWLMDTGDTKMEARYTEGWGMWLLPLPWVVFALTPPDPNAPYDRETEIERQHRSAEARRRRKGGSFSR